jgi:hypothetical protein
MFLVALPAVCELALIRIFLDPLDEVGDKEVTALILERRQISKRVGLVARGLTICFSY